MESTNREKVAFAHYHLCEANDPVDPYTDAEQAFVAGAAFGRKQNGWWRLIALAFAGAYVGNLCAQIYLHFH